MSAMNPGRLLLTALLLLACGFGAQTARAAGGGSRCVALAGTGPDVHFVSLNQTAAAPGEVAISFVGHATFRIESTGGVIIATDYAGYAGAGRIRTWSR